MKINIEACGSCRAGMLRSVLAGLALFAAGSANAAFISVFNDGAYVDTGTEGANLIGDLSTLGHTVSTFTGSDGASWLAGIGGNSILVIPEAEIGNLDAGLSAGAKTAITNFVIGGGSLIQANYFPGNASLANALFGWSLTQTGSIGTTSLDATGAAGTAFAGGPATLPVASAIEGVLTSSLPGSARNIYSDGTNTSVFTADVGAGVYTYLGFDWFQSPTPSDWVTVLDSAVSQQGRSVPAPATLLLLGVGLAGIARWRKPIAAS